jgi:hypothetical protein
MEHKKGYTLIFRRNPLASPHICYFCTRASWCHLWRMFSIAREAAHALLLAPPLRLHIGVHVTQILAVRKYWSQKGLYLDRMLGGRRSSNFSFRMVPTVAAAVWCRVFSWCKTTPFVSIPLRLLRRAVFNSSSSITQYRALFALFREFW